MPQFLRLPSLTWLLLLANWPNFVLQLYLAVTHQGTVWLHWTVALIVGVALIAIYVLGRKTQKINDNMKQWNLHDFSSRGMSTKEDTL
jgi:hypothetical protein